VLNDFLALSRNVSITRYAAFGPPLAAVPAKGRYRIFIALAGPTDKSERLELEGDRKAILRAVQAVKEDGRRFEPLMADPATKLKILNGSASSDIFHFGGHGDFSFAQIDSVTGEMIDQGRLYLGDGQKENSQFDSDEFARLLGNSQVRLVVLGACKSAQADGRNNWLGLAPALVRENIPAVVGMQYKVGDLNSARFFHAMYRFVLDGFSIDEAVFEGRQAISTLAGLEDRDWGNPVLYMRAKDGLLFKRPPAVEKPAPRQFPGMRININVGRNEGTVRALSVGKATSAGLQALSSLNIDADMQVDVVTETGVVESMHVDEIIDKG
jgi:hypothetical protein